MESILLKLVAVYGKERSLYARILERVHRQRDLIASGASYAEINAELARKRDLLLEVEALEDGVQRERALWKSRRQELDGLEAQRLIALLADVTDLVETIITRERENEILLTSRRRNGPRPVVSEREAVASYQAQNGAGVER